MAVLLFVVILGILVFVHELGHFAVARWSGVTVEEFGFGFPPRIFGRRRGNTLYSINWIPFGGFVRLQGEQEDAAARAGSFVQARYSRQLAIMAAGVTMNALLAWFLITTTLIIGVSGDANNLPNNQYIQHGPVRVEAVVTSGSAADQAGIKTGDIVTAVNGQAYTSTDQVIALAKEQNFPELRLDIERQGVVQQISVKPRYEIDRPRYGLGIQAVTSVHYPWYIAPWYGLIATGDLVVQTLRGFWTLIHDLVVTAHVSSDLTGPVGIAVLTGQVAQYGFTATLQFMAILSVSLAVVNFLPLPALDGGRALFVTIARLRGRPMNTRIEGTIHAIGFYGLLLVIILLSIRDISRFKLFDQLRSLFQ